MTVEGSGPEAPGSGPSGPVPWGTPPPGGWGPPPAQSAYSLKRVDPRRRRVLGAAKGVAVVIVLAGAVWASVRWVVPAVQEWASGSSEVTADEPTQCEQAFTAAVADPSRAVETVTRCTEGEWALQQTLRPLAGVTLRSLCDGRGATPGQACATADADRAAEVQAFVAAAEAQRMREAEQRAAARQRSVQSYGSSGSGNTGAAAPYPGGTSAEGPAGAAGPGGAVAGGAVAGGAGVPAPGPSFSGTVGSGPAPGPGVPPPVGSGFSFG